MELRTLCLAFCFVAQSMQSALAHSGMEHKPCSGRTIVELAIPFIQCNALLAIKDAVGLVSVPAMSGAMLGSLSGRPDARYVITFDEPFETILRAPGIKVSSQSAFEETIGQVITKEICKSENRYFLSSGGEIVVDVIAFDADLKGSPLDRFTIQISFSSCETP